MGAISSLIDTPGGYSVLQRNSETWHCRFCGSAYNDVCTKDMIHISGLENHHPAELCGIWLGKLYLNQTRDIRLSDFRAISTSPLHCAENECNFESTGSPLITLPKRSCAPAKSHVATLLRHSDATKNHSTLREEFFSTMDIRNSSSAQYTELEGCRITGCLFVEHGNLVFQAISKRSRIPFLLIDQQMLGPTSDCISSAFNSFKGGFPDDPKTHNSIQNSSLICSSTESSSHLINLDKSGQKCLISHVDNPYASTNRCSEDFKPRHPPPPLRLSWPLVTLRRFGFYGNSLFKVETGRRAPRGEGIYLFRIKHLREFRKSFEAYIHHRRDNLSVHQLSTTASESRSLLRNNINSNTGKLSFIMPFNKIFHKHSSASLLSTTHILRGSIINDKSDQTLLNEQRDHLNNTSDNETLRHPSRQHVPVLSERNNLAFSFDDAEIDFFQSQNVKLTTNKSNKIQQQKQEYQDRVSSNCLHWLQLQSSPDYYSNENSHQRVNNKSNYNNKHSSTKLQHNFKHSCPQLNDITSINPINWNNNNNNRNDAKHICSDSQRHHVGGSCSGCCLRGGGSYQRSNHHRSHCLDEDTDDDKIVDIDECTVEEEEEIFNLPEAPLPPVCNNSSYCDIMQDGQNDYQKIYDNLIVVNNGVNNNNDSNNTLVRQSFPSVTEIGNTASAHCCTHQQMTSLNLSKNDERTEKMHNVLNCNDEIDRKKPTERQSHVSSIDVGVGKADVAISSVGEQQNNTCQNSPTLLRQSLSSDMNFFETFDKSNSVTTNNTTTNDPKEDDVIKKCKNKSQTLILPRLPSITTSSKMYLHSRHASLPNPNTCASSSNAVSSRCGSISCRDNNGVEIDTNRCCDENLSFRSHKKLSSDYLCKIHRNLSNSADRKNSDLLDMITEYSPYYNLLTNPETLTQLQCTGRCTSQTIAPPLLGEYNPECTHSSSVSCLPNDFTTNYLPSSANHPIVDDNINRASCCSSYFKELPIQNSHNRPLVLAGSSSTTNAIISVITTTTTLSSTSITTTSASSVPHSINNLGYHKHYERPTSMLHYATLDFGPVTLETCQYRNESYSDMNNARRNNDMPNTLTGSSYTHRYCPVNNITTASTTNNNGNSGDYNQDNLTESCSSHIYGTLTDTLHSHVIESSCQNHFCRHNVSNNNNNSHCDDMIHDETDTDLPSNYVAICQLQTLAMRAVLSATT